MGNVVYPQESLRRRGANGLTDGRTPFARDRDRLLYSDAVHGLSGKSQVISGEHIGQFHNRMTHSLKVAQLGRRLAERIRERHGGAAAGCDIAAPDPDLVEFSCLAHDIGHPPFGHNGEKALQASVDKAIAEATPDDNGRMIGFGGFEGNPQSFRIITRLTQKRLDNDEYDGGSWVPDSWFGMDPTAASMDAVSKYPWTRRAGYDKWGCYGEPDCPESDAAMLFWARSITGGSLLYDARLSFEAQIMDWSDDIAYAVHDVEDFYRAGMIPLHLIFGDGGKNQSMEQQEWEKFREHSANRWTSTDKWTGMSMSSARDRLDHIRDSLSEQVRGMRIGSLHDDSAADLRAASFRSSRLTRHFMLSVDVEDGGEPLLHRGNLSVSRDSDTAELLVDQCDLLKELIWAYVLKSRIISDIRESQRIAVTDLFSYFLENSHLMPRYYLDIMEYGSGCVSEPEARIRTTADYVSSLTDNMASGIHNRVIGTGRDGSWYGLDIPNPNNVLGSLPDKKSRLGWLSLRGLISRGGPRWTRPRS